MKLIAYVFVHNRTSADIFPPEGKEILTLNRATKYIPTKAENYQSLEAAGRSAGLIK